jgi:GT2 family glycosyltransferase
LTAGAPVQHTRDRPIVRGKFVHVGDDKLYVRGVTYGTFAPNGANEPFPDREIVAHDFALMRGAGINTVRTYDVPPRWLLDLAAEHGLLVMAGLPWEQHVAFLEDRDLASSIVDRVRVAVRACRGHPAILAYVVGNEVPASIVRWHGPRRVERLVERLYHAAKDEDGEALVTYVNYPSTEYLELPSLDLVCFNVYLETEAPLDAYIARLQNLAGERPLLLTELGLDSQRHSLDRQGELLEGQIRAAFRDGCAGVVTFAWTDEWHRGGHDVLDWDFGLVDRGRRPKPALAAVQRAFANAPFAGDDSWPRISVVVCTHNGSRTLRGCLEDIAALEYPDYELLVVDDGSTDGSAAIAEEYGARVVRTENRGLASARNTGLEAATGELVAYLDDDARPDPHWLRYIASAFANGPYAGVGGPNLAPPGDGDVPDCIANAPGGPIHVLLSDREAEHIPGCNMAFRKACLEAIGGFDAQFRIAGDDVDVCWRLQEQGFTLGFSAAAVVWHHRRASVSGFWRQQREYGRAEALLERKWPERYNTVGHVSWAGRLYNPLFSRTFGIGRRIRYGIWGTAAFQPALPPRRPVLSAVGMPEWYLLIGALAALAALGALWRPLLLVVPVLAVAVLALLVHAFAGAVHARYPERPRSRLERLRLRALTAWLYVIQPAARLTGRLAQGLTPWRRRGSAGLVFPIPRMRTVWSETWRATNDRLRALDGTLRASGAVVRHGGPFDRWDLEVQGGPFGATRLRMALEEHGEGKQLARFRLWPRLSPLSVCLLAVFVPLAVLAGLDNATAAGAALAGIALAIVVIGLKDCASSLASALAAVAAPGTPEAPSAGLAEQSLIAELLASLNGSHAADGGGEAKPPALEGVPIRPRDDG